MYIWIHSRPESSESPESEPLSTEMFKGNNNVLPLSRLALTLEQWVRLTHIIYLILYIIWVNRTHCFRVKVLWLKGRTLFLPLNISAELQVKWLRLRRLGRLRSYTSSHMLVIPWLMVHESYFEKIKIVVTFPSNGWYHSSFVFVISRSLYFQNLSSFSKATLKARYNLYRIRQRYPMTSQKIIKMQLKIP